MAAVNVDNTTRILITDTDVAKTALPNTIESKKSANIIMAAIPITSIPKPCKPSLLCLGLLLSSSVIAGSSVPLLAASK